MTIQSPGPARHVSLQRQSFPRGGDDYPEARARLDVSLQRQSFPRGGDDYPETRARPDVSLKYSKGLHVAAMNIQRPGPARRVTTAKFIHMSAMNIHSCDEYPESRRVTTAKLCTWRR